MRITGDRTLLRISGIVIPVIMCVLLLSAALSSERDLNSLKSRQKELSLLKEEYLLLKGRVDSVEGKKSLSQVKGIVQAVDELLLPMGLKQKIKSVKPTGVKELKDATEEEAEVHIEKADMNETVNIFYKIENAPMALSVKKAVIKTSFENPAYVNITMVLALIRQK